MSPLRESCCRQWAAVRTCLSETRDPPHLPLAPDSVDLRLSKAAQGNSLISENSPPMIVDCRVRFGLDRNNTVLIFLNATTLLFIVTSLILIDSFHGIHLNFPLVL